MQIKPPQAPKGDVKIVRVLFLLIYLGYPGGRIDLPQPSKGGE
mgnify:FL=1